MKASQLYLYHGSDVVIDSPKWNLGSSHRDFGQCFYTTHSREMATDWAIKHSALYPVTRIEGTKRTLDWINNVEKKGNKSAVLIFFIKVW